jgi:signal transduction histidine kinase
VPVARHAWLRLLVQPPAAVQDAALALGMVAFVELTTQWGLPHLSSTPFLGPAARLLLAGAALPVGLHRRIPALAFVATLGMTAAFLALTSAWGPVMVAPSFALLNLVARSSVRVWAPLIAAGTALLAVERTLTLGWSTTTFAYAGGWLGAAALFGTVLGFRRRLRAEAEAGERWAVRSREEQGRRRLAEERLRLAREVHDVVGHSLAVISLQAGVAEHLLDSRPEEARRALGAIRRVSKQALDDLRAELAALRGLADAGDRAPSPRLRDLPQLIGAMRDAGLEVSLDVDGAEDGLPEVIAAAGYRIVQESLTNVVRHAQAAAAEVRVRVHAEGIELEVVDDGHGAAGGRSQGGGLTGMHERALALGGRLEAGNRAEGGFRVWAWLPRESAAEDGAAMDRGLGQPVADAIR